MDIRKMLNNPAVAAAVVAAVILIVVVARMARGGDRQLEGYAFFYDVDRHELTAIKSPDELPPVTTEHGTRAVRAVMFGCGGCEDKAERTVGYLEMWDDASKAAVTAMAQAPVDETVPGAAAGVAQRRDMGHLVARYVKGQAPQWFPAGSPTGREILASSTKLCPNARKPLSQCSPLSSDVR